MHTSYQFRKTTKSVNKQGGYNVPDGYLKFHFRIYNSEKKLQSKAKYLLHKDLPKWDGAKFHFGNESRMKPRLSATAQGSRTL
jgi:hypothetical protein